MDRATDLASELREIQVQASLVLKNERRLAAIPMAVDGACKLASFVALSYLAYLGLAHLTGSPWPSLDTATLLVVPGLALAFFLAALFLAGRRSISQGEALAVADQRHDFADRLQTAAEFLLCRERTSFMEAALLDAVQFAKVAKAQGLPKVEAPVEFSRRVRISAGATLLFLLLAFLIPAPLVAEVKMDSESDNRVARLDPAQTSARERVKERQAAARKKEESEKIESTKGTRAVAARGRKDSIDSSDIKRTRGVLGSGQSSDASSASGSSEARGAPSQQAQASLAGKKPAKKKKKRQAKKHKKPKTETLVARKEEESSGATAGRGAASGSNKSPSPSPWSSKDQVTSDDEEDLEDDEEVDDEFDNSDARGGVQPHLRDRRPPVNRDLGIGFGNQKNPDANGRGGPSELKKSRGVASLVLGVPISDHVKGRPNPGKTKITQERVEPEAEDAAAVKAGQRAPRNAPLGSFESPPLNAWMRDLIRNYFRLIRQTGNEPSKTSKQQDKSSGD